MKKNTIKELNEKIKINEQFDVEKAIDDLIKTNFSATEDSRGKAAQLLRGLLFSDDPKASAFIQKLDKMLSGMAS